MNTLSKQNGEGETNRGDSTMFESDDDQHLVKNNIGEGGEQGKKKKKKKPSEKRKHNEYNQFKSDECEDGDGGKKMKKKRRLIEGNTLKDCNDFRSNEGEDGEQGKKLKKKKKKKKRSEETKQKDYKEVKSSECEDDDKGKKMKKKQKLVEGDTLNVRNDFSSNEGEGEDEEQAKKLKKKKKKQSEESKQKDHKEVKSNEYEDDGHGKKMKKEKKLVEEGRLKEYDDIISNGDGDQGKSKKKKNKPSHKRKSKNNDFNSNQGEVNDQGKKMKEKKKAKTATSESPNHAYNESPNFAQNGTSKPKRVTFSDQVEEYCCDGLVRGKRFTPEEDEKIRAAVHDYIVSHDLGDEGVDMILHCSSHPSVRDCWKEIAKALPHRPRQSVYKRGHVLLENTEKFTPTPEECDFVRKAYEQHGPDWRAIADALGKSRHQVKDLWRRIKYTELNKGPWSQEEYQTLFNLVNLDLRTRALQPFRKSQHGMLRDNICWEAISHKLKTRESAICCDKWYSQLISPMIASDDWLESDDYRLIDALYALDACCMEEVDWDNLLEHRSGDVCRKRWNEMVQHIGDRIGMSFIEQVEILAKRFCPDLLEAREAFDNKPVIC